MNADSIFKNAALIVASLTLLTDFSFTSKVSVKSTANCLVVNDPLIDEFMTNANPA